ncbi:hypothetical protein [Parapedobacter tibetensis]|uniref:hypothetical protein n=1 Tax=Parapedobacter tibetensis TaxID=2972951 RepID=UPI00214D267D|nr:hypothetical protein [Parapedobacter tibetensis]
MKRKLNKISMVVVATVMFCAIMFLSMEKNEQDEWEFAAVSASAQGGDGESGGTLKQYYDNDPLPCVGTETRHCDIAIVIPGTAIYCSVGFDYTVEFDGTQNYCDYTGNPQTYCNYHTCQRN